jgi:hypothetical protein
MNYVTQKWESPLLRPRLICTDIFVHELTPDELQMIRDALGKGLTPSGFDVAGNTVILRFGRNEWLAQPRNYNGLCAWIEAGKPDDRAIPLRWEAR